jgi:hypothetical protein
MEQRWLCAHDVLVRDSTRPPVRWGYVLSTDGSVGHYLDERPSPAPNTASAFTAAELDERFRRRRIIRTVPPDQIERMLAQIDRAALSELKREPRAPAVHEQQGRLPSVLGSSCFQFRADEQVYYEVILVRTAADLTFNPSDEAGELESFTSSTFLEGTIGLRPPSVD